MFGYLMTHDQGMNPDEVTMAEILKLKGYVTACIGKWHLGNKTPFMPRNQGFDYFYGLPYSNNMNPKVLYRNEEIIEDPFDNAQLTQQFTQEAINWI